MKFRDLFRSPTPSVVIPRQPHFGSSLKRSAFTAASVDRITQSWFTQLLGPNREMTTDVKRLRGLSRHLARNNAYANRYRTLIETRVVGPDGFQFQPRIVDQKGDAIDAINSELSQKWEKWKTMAGLNGKHFLDIEHLVIATTVIDGEIFVRLITDARVNEFGLALQLIDADLLDNEYTVANYNGNTIVQGVEIDRFGVAVAYHFHTMHPNDIRTGQPLSRERIPADEILHIYKEDRVGQYRGLPWMTKVLKDLAQLDDYRNAELVAAQAAAMNIATIEKDKNDTSAYVTNDSDKDKEPERELIDLETGTMLVLDSGETMKPWVNNRPATAFDAFTKSVLHGIASGLNVSYSTLASDMSQDTYSSARMSGNYEQKYFDTLQSWLVRQFHEKVYKVWLDTAMSKGAVELLGAPEDYHAVVFRGMKMQSPDLLKDMNAATLGFQNNVTSKTQFCAERGYDYKQVLNERYEEMKLERQFEKYLKEDGLEPVDIQNEIVLANAQEQEQTLSPDPESEPTNGVDSNEDITTN